MSLRFGTLYDGGFYHIFNRGVEKRDIFMNPSDFDRFLLLLEVLNSNITIASIKNMSYGDLESKKQEIKNATPLVEIYAYALLPNHFHLVIRQVQDSGVSKFMQKLGMAYANYFNAKHKRKGTLFQGKYKYIELKDDNHVKRVICYVNKNIIIHKLDYRLRKPITSEYLYQGGGEGALGHFCVYQDGLDLFGSQKVYQKQSQTVMEKVLCDRFEDQDILE